MNAFGDGPEDFEEDDEDEDDPADWYAVLLRFLFVMFLASVIIFGGWCILKGLF